jgi:tetratricopeptide (TPR) repeat protein
MPLFKKSPAAVAPTIDPAFGDDEARRLRGDLETGNFETSQAVLEKTRSWDDREFLVTALTEWDGRPSWIDPWLRAHHQSAIPFLIRGAHGVKWAWSARGGGKAETVSEGGWDLFFRRLKDADEELHQAASRDEADPTPWAHLLAVARGLEQGFDQAQEYFNEAKRRDPWAVWAHLMMLQLLTQKWGGSHEAMFDFARATSAAAPKGSLVHRVIADAHVERFLYLAAWEKDEKGANNYFRRDDVKREIYDMAERSVWAAEYQPSKRAAMDRNVFAFCFSLMGDSKAARREFEAIGPVVTRQPWVLLGEPVSAFSKRREMAS